VAAQVAASGGPSGQPAEAIDLTGSGGSEHSSDDDVDDDSNVASGCGVAAQVADSGRPSKQQRLRVAGRAARYRSYADQRLALDSLPRMRLGRRADPRHARSISEDEEQTFGAELPSVTLSLAAARAFRNEMSERFHLSGSRVAFRTQP
jgi:hypothetical protein